MASPDPSVGCKEAIEWVLNSLGDSVEEPYKATLEAILIQRGVERHDPVLEAEGRLTDLMDLVIFG